MWVKLTEAQLRISIRELAAHGVTIGRHERAVLDRAIDIMETAYYKEGDDADKSRKKVVRGPYRRRHNV